MTPEERAKKLWADLASAWDERVFAIITQAIKQAENEAYEKAAKAVQHMPPCPFEDGTGYADIAPDRPCPVCGDLGIFVDDPPPSKCRDAAHFIRSLKHP